LHRLEGGENLEALDRILGQVEPNGVLKLFTACVSTVRKPDVLLVLLE